MPGKAAHLLAVALLIGSGCTAHRVIGNRAEVDQVVHSGVSLHGLFGSRDDLSQVRELIPLPGASTPLPPFWDRDVPLDLFEGEHKPLYLDPTLIRPGTGADLQCKEGLECSTLAFYTGHGLVDRWNIPNNEVLLSQVKVGDGPLRYFWLYSCNVLAHGPKIDFDGDGNGDDFPLPHQFQHRDEDLFRRWRSAFGPHLRMACGGSTQLGRADVRQIWENLLAARVSVPDAFILGTVQPKENQVPVCLARGRRHPISSALSDRTLRPEEFPYRDLNWRHLQMPVTCKVEPVKPKSPWLRVQCGGESPVSAAADDELPALALKTLPVVTTTALLPPLPPEQGRLPLGFKQLTADSKYHPDSGAIVLIKSRDRYSRLDQCNQETTWIVNPKALLAENHLDPKLLPSTSPDVNGPQKSLKITALEMRVESRQNGAPIEKRKCRVRSLFLRYDNEIKIGAESFPVFGPGINFEIHGEDPRLASFSAPNRELTFSAALPMLLKLEGTAISEAHEELNLELEIYPERAARATLGYEEAPLHCRQKFLRPTYEILFPPNRPDYPTVIVRRDARDSTDKSGSSWECREWND